MNAVVSPKKLSGTIFAPSSKSLSHRLLIAASLAYGTSEISNVSASDDISATVDAMSALGAHIRNSGGYYFIDGIGARLGDTAVINCRESGSTLRFSIPIAAALGIDASYYGSGRLPQRPITPYEREMSAKGVKFDHTQGVMPFNVSGKLHGGAYSLEGNVSSQFITGLMFALPLCAEDSVITLKSKLESKPYADMTRAVLNNFGIVINETTGSDGLPVYTIKGNQKYCAYDCTVEGDYSQAAFFFVANALGSNIKINNLDKNSVQGDKKILEILDKIGYNKKECGLYSPFIADASDIPDLVPILAVLACFSAGKCSIINAARLKIKESDRLRAVVDALCEIGGNVKSNDNSLEITPVKAFRGGVVNGCGDHRIVMATAIAATMAVAPIVITGCDAVAKSYPAFWDDFKALGGEVEFV